MRLYDHAAVGDAMITISFNGTTVSLIVRGKHSAEHEPSLMAQHADCILPDGAPIGYFGDEGVGTGESLQSSSGSFSGWSNSSGMNMRGFVADYQRFLAIRPYYVDVGLARRYGIISTVLMVEVGEAEASRFQRFWRELTVAPGTFNILGHNCSTHASKAFRYAGILANGIAGLDTPNNLYKQIARERAGRTAAYSGYIGFTRDDNRFELCIESIKRPTEVGV